MPPPPIAHALATSSSPSRRHHQHRRRRQRLPELLLRPDAAGRAAAGSGATSTASPKLTLSSTEGNHAIEQGLGEGPDEYDGVLQKPLVPCCRLDPTSCSWCRSTQEPVKENQHIETTTTLLLNKV